MPGSVPSLLAGTPYPSEHDNYLCARYWGAEAFGDTYELPCRPPRAEYQSTLADEFVITAWWPPTHNVIHQYAAANFNLMLGGNTVAGCQRNGTTPSPATVGEAFDCIMRHVPDVERLGLKLAFSLGNTWNRSTPDQVRDQTLGGAASFGGVNQFGPAGYLTAKEVQWVVGEFARRNSSHALHSIFLHDDVTVAQQSLLDTTKWLRAHAPRVLPLTNGGIMQSLYQTSLPVWSPEEYVVSGDDDKNATEEAWDMLATYSQNQMMQERYGIDVWPLFNVNKQDDQGHEKTFMSDSLMRVQVFSAIAYGARGLYYYCWGDGGLWDIERPDQYAGPGKPTPNYETARAANADALVWGKALLKARHVGAVMNPSVAIPQCHFGDKTSVPGSWCSGFHKYPKPAADDLAVTAIDVHLIVGAFTVTKPQVVVEDDEDREESGGVESSAFVGYLMVVDTRVATKANVLPVRNASLTTHPACAPTVIAGGDASRGALQRTHSVSGSVVSVGLEAGGGQLIGLAGGPDCHSALARVRHLHYSPRVIKAGTFENPMLTRLGSGRRRFMPGGLAKASSTFLIGGSYWESGEGWSSSPWEAEAWEQAGFSFASLRGDNITLLIDSLGLANAFGINVLASGPATADGTGFSVPPPAMIADLMTKLSCHSSFVGFHLSSSGGSGGGSGAAEVALSADTIRRDGYWTLPLATSVPSVEAALELASIGVPLPAVALPGLESSGDATEWGSESLSLLAKLQKATRNESAPLTMAVTLDACMSSPASDSLLRFGAVASVLYGAQALWWDGVGHCAPIGSPTFALIAELNRRLAQWAGPFVLKRGNRLPPRFKITNAWSTSSLKIPPFIGTATGEHGTESPAREVPVRKPGGNGPADLVQAMDPELLVVEMANATNLPQGMPQRVLLVVSTVLSKTAGGAPTRTANVSLSSGVFRTVPLEPDALQGYGDVVSGLGWKVPGEPDDYMGTQVCPLGWVGPLMPLKLPGGASQMVRLQFHKEAGAGVGSATGHGRQARPRQMQRPMGEL